MAALEMSKQSQVGAGGVMIRDAAGQVVELPFEIAAELQEDMIFMDQNQQHQQQKGDDEFVGEEDEFFVPFVADPLQKDLYSEKEKKVIRKKMIEVKRMGGVLHIEEDKVQEEYRPYFTYTSLLVNIMMFVWLMWKADWVWSPLELNPMFGPDPQLLIANGAKSTPLILLGEWWRLVLPMFLHSGVIHLAMNMLALFRIGGSLEQAFGWWRVGLIFILSGFCGLLYSAIFLPQMAQVGASGAIYGLIGAMIADFMQNFDDMKEGKFCYLFQLAFCVVVGLGIGLLPMLDNFGHFFGFLCGLFAGLCLLAPRCAQCKDVDMSRGFMYACYSDMMIIISMTLTVSICLVGIVVLYAGIDPDKYCEWCDYISCVETPWWDCALKCIINRNGTESIEDCPTQS